MKTYGVIMAGGGGTRFWPLSTKAEPKQFLNLSGKDILVNETIDRQHDLMDQKDIFILGDFTRFACWPHQNNRIARPKFSCQVC